MTQFHVWYVPGLTRCLSADSGVPSSRLHITPAAPRRPAAAAAAARRRDEDLTAVSSTTHSSAASEPLTTVTSRGGRTTKRSDVDVVDVASLDTPTVRQQTHTRVGAGWQRGVVVSGVRR